MPELPEVEGVVRSLIPVVTGKVIRRVTLSETVYTSHAQGKEAVIKKITLPAFISAVEGMKIESIERRSKYIYLHVTKNEVAQILVSHLGMSGAWFYVADPSEITEGKFHKHIHVTFLLDDGHYLIYSDIRRFGELRLLQSLADYPSLLQLAPEPFDEEAFPYFLQKCRSTKYKNKMIKAVIMDHNVLCGSGNIYSTEALFRTKINPGQKVSNLTDLQLTQLFKEIVAVLLESIGNGGSSISDYRNINGEAGSMQNFLQMYGMKKCPMCHTNSEQMMIAGRNSYFCPECQKME